MKITWLGHACFALESDGYRVLLDPYTKVRGHEELQVSAHKTLCSHEHFDHNARDAVAMPLVERPCPFTIETMDTYHDDVQGKKRGKNTVHILKAENMIAVHLGDLGHLLSGGQAEKLRDCDVLMIPVGGTYTVDAIQAKAVVEQIQPKVVIPMHYRHGKYGFEELDTVERFVDLFPAACVQQLSGNEWEVAVGAMPQVIVFDGNF